MLYFVILLSISLLISQTTPTLSSLIHKILFKRPNEPDFAFLTGEDSNSVTNCAKEICDENKLMLRLATMKVISPERVILMFTLDNLNDLCRKLGTNIDEVKHEFKSCAPLKSDNLYWMLFRGVESMHGKLCNSTKPGKSLQNLINSRDCIVELREEYIDCEGPADWIEKENRSILCEIYHDIINCQFVKTAELCGMDVAHSLRILTKTVFDGTLSFDCNVGEPPKILSPMPNDGPSVSSATKFYEPGGLEKWGDQIIYTLSLMWNVSLYTSPLILTFLYRRGYFVAESVSSFAKISTGIGLLVVISLCMRGIGRSQTKIYSKFVKSLEAAKANTKNEDIKNQLRLFDFEFTDWPVDFSIKEVEGDKSKVAKAVTSVRSKPYWISSLPCEIAAYLAIHAFGLRMIYPGSVKLIQSYLHPMLVQGRAKLIEEDRGKRYKLLTRDDNEVDSIFIDNRGGSVNGKTLVICSEGNAGFYEIGIMMTPLALKYSVLGWNHPGFGGSTGKPFPDQDQNAMNAVMQFAINKLGFLPENILLFGWSIGGYSSLWASTQYPDIKGVLLDATFDDVLQLALPRMPESLSGVVRIAIRQYVNLNNSELLNNYNGSILMIRRTEDEVISENMDVATNRCNNLLINMLKNRFPNVVKSEQINLINKMLSRPIEKTTDNSTDQLCLSLLLSYVSENGKSYPLEIGENYTEEQRNQMVEYLVYKHMLDYKSSHCTPLPAEYFQIPWALPDDDTDFVFT